MEWNTQEDDYPQIDINDDHIAGLSLWLEKIAELTHIYDGEWNVLIADLWPNDNYSRLIGHVQMANVAIGYDTGFRVCAYLKNDGIVGDSGDDRPLIRQWLKVAAANTKTKAILTELNQSNPFEIRLSEHGSGPINKAIKIEY